MQNQRSRIYGGFIILWVFCAIVLGIQAGMAGASIPERSLSLESGAGLTIDDSMYFVPGITDQTDPLSVLIYREAKGKRKLEPRADCSEWQVIYRWALMAC
jgi:hypothetical protein